MTKYLFLDIDGTLVDYNGELPESAEIALKAAQKNGHKLIVCTGRFLGQVYPWLLKKINFDGIITSSGANVRFGGRTIFTKYFARQQLKFLSDCYISVGATSFCHLDDILVSRDEEELRRTRDNYLKVGVSEFIVNELLGNVRFGDVSALDGVEKSIYCGASIGLAEMRKLLGEEYNVDLLSVEGATENYGEVNLSDVNKARGIRELISALGADMSDTIAIGDSGNDLSMVKAANIGVAMGNATEELKSVADVIADDISNGGIYKIFCELGLI